MKNILCFGDSNTFGSNPSGVRWPRNVRWTGRLQKLLGDEYYIIEEGCGGRTTIWDDALEPFRNGYAALPIFLQSHKPLDLVIISLGTNDCKTHFNASPKVITKGIDLIVKTIRSFSYGAGYSAPDIMIISPIHIDEEIEASTFVSFDYSSVSKSKALTPLYKSFAQQNNCLFVNASLVAESSKIDKLHMDANSHAALANSVALAVKGHFSTSIT